jgi:uncharacterized protein (DUF305 family)
VSVVTTTTEENDAMRARPLALAATTITLTMLLAACGSSTQTSTQTTGSAAGASSTASTSLAPGSASDIAFAQLMIPHHEQAVQMADLAERYAESATVKEMAARIKAAQTPEIQSMTTWLTTWDQPTVMPSSSDGGMDGMDMGGMSADSGLMSDNDLNALTQARGTAFDRTWLLMMIAHHQSAISMAEEVLSTTANPEVKDLATAIQSGQATEISTMRQLLAG